MEQSYAEAAVPGVARQPYDVGFCFFGISWAGSVARGRAMPEDRLAEALLRHPDVRRVLICTPYRHVAGGVVAALRGRREAPFPTSPRASLHEPRRLRRSDRADARASVRRYEAGMRRAAERLGLEAPSIISASPLLAGFGGFSWASSVTYYAWDDWSASEPHKRWWPAYEAAFAQLRERGRKVCAVSRAALDAVAPTGAGIVVPNGIEPLEWRSPPPAPAWFAARPSPRLLYVGSLDGRIDIAQVREVARAHSGGSITFVGNQLDPRHLDGLRDLPNVSFHPSVPRGEITGIMTAADACLIPHVRNRLTEAMSPLKLYEYLAAGRPVAAVSLPPIAAVSGRVALAPPGSSLVPAVEAALRLGPAPEAERLAFIAGNSWDRRFESLLAFAREPG